MLTLHQADTLSITQQTTLKDEDVSQNRTDSLAMPYRKRAVPVILNNFDDIIFIELQKPWLGDG